MSYTISENNIIRMNRGDTFSFDFTISDENSPEGRYILKNDDVLYLGLMDPHQPFENALVKKRYTKDDCDEMGNLIIKFLPEDTLDLVPGVYYYSIKLHKITDDEEDYVDEVVTIINKTKFIICD
jgi:hypothetical protein